jgi:2-aminoadipate transaminase
MSTPIEQMFCRNLPPAVKPWSGFPAYNFVGGHNDRDAIPVEALANAMTKVLREKGRDLATYHMDGGPQGLRELRDIVARQLTRDRGMKCDADQVLITSGSAQGLDLVNNLLLEPGDTVIIEEFTFGIMLNMVRAKGAKIVAAPLDEFGIRVDALEQVLDDLENRGTTPKYIYTIPTVQNPTGSVMPLERRRAVVALAESRGIPIFEDECYSNLIWEGEAPPSLRALSKDNHVIHIGSFSKSLAPALRLGYLIADWPVMSRILSLKVDGGTGALAQMLAAEFLRDHYDAHLGMVRTRLKTKLESFVETVAREFGAGVELSVPAGGIFLWLRLPEEVDTSALSAAALAEGVAFDPGADWAVDTERGRHHLRLCFALSGEEEIREGIAKLAAICRRETGFPRRSGNIDHTAR